MFNNLGNDVFANPGKYGLSDSDIARYQNAVKTNQGLGHDKGPDPDHPRPVMLGADDPLAFNGKGRAAIAIGNPDRTQNAAVIVPPPRLHPNRRVINKGGVMAIMCWTGCSSARSGTSVCDHRCCGRAFKPTEGNDGWPLRPER